MAYAAYYGHQPLTEIFSRSRSDLQAFNGALSRLIEWEQKKRPSS